MTFTKMNLGDADPVFVIDAPPAFLPHVESVAAERTVASSLSGVTGATFILAFATTLTQVRAFAASVAATAIGDATVWIAYPKMTSRKYTCEFHRDTGWEAMGEAGFEPVRQVAIDEDWSALRFRRVEFITRWTRSFAYSDEGIRRIAEADGTTP